MPLQHCLQCKEKKELIDGKLDYYKNGTPVIKGKCAACGASLCRIMNREERAELRARQEGANEHE